MSEAIFGLVGVVVGSAITWAIEIWRARRTDADEGRVAARLVADELQSIDNARTLEEPEFQRQREMALRQEAWITHRAALARELGDDQWRAVREAYDALAYPPGAGRAEAFVNESHARGMQALKPLMSSDRRYWWQRAWRRIKHSS